MQAWPEGSGFILSPDKKTSDGLMTINIRWNKSHALKVNSVKKKRTIQEFTDLTTWSGKISASPGVKMNP